MLVSGSETALGLSLFVEQVLTDLAVAFGHSFVLIEDKASALSKKEYGSPMTEELIENAADCDGILYLSPDREGLPELAEGLGCILGCHVFALPDALNEFSALKTDQLPRGLLAYPLTGREEDWETCADSLFELSKELKFSVAVIPFSGERGERWNQAVRAAETKQQVLSEKVSAQDFIRKLIENPQEMGSLLAAPALAHSSIYAAATALCGKAESFVYDSFWNVKGPRLYSSILSDAASAETVNPFGALFAACDMLKHGFGLNKEAEFLFTCCKNALEAGWRTADTAAGDEAGVVPAQDIIRIISEQIELVAALTPR